ncbi:MAG TPA: hypothetical protein VL202_00085 [Pararhizobium sp.]|uniref:hypothetical protein n=1 Tax=Pararhizobium sp. TaxID=1977563 RepID=UPI002C02CD6D|nr:hypothetical protein [Pararhizobium sp.]HTO29569.1 hypothetical protein [Pararhizobium sp.]
MNGMQMLIAKTLLLAMVLAAPSLVATAPAASAQQVQLTQVYPDLPGVKTPEEAEQAKVVVCEQTVIHHENHPTFGREYETVNNCHKGNGPTFQSRNSPLSIERQLRGFNY